jgi:hypothetical protein
MNLGKPINNIKTKLRKEFFIQPLSQDNKDNKKYTNEINKLFNDPNHYFSTRLNGKEIVIGKKLSNIKYHNNIPLIQTKPTKKYFFSKKRSSQIANLKGNINIPKSSIIKINSRQSQNLKPNQKYIDNNGLKEIYDNFKHIQNTSSSISKKNLINPDNIIKKEITQIFNIQTKSLHKFLTENNHKNKIISKIIKKTKKPKKDILMNTLHLFRVKKEFINHIQEESNKILQKPIFSWNTSLRNTRNSNKQYFVNIGLKNPEWFLFKNSNDDLMNNETIRNPSFDRNVYKNKSLRTFFHNEYLKKNFPKSYSYFENLNSQNSDNNTNEFSDSIYPSEFNSLHIKGKNLLSFELGNSKLLKGKKILNSSDFSPDQTKDFIFKDSMDSPSFKSSFSYRK